MKRSIFLLLFLCSMPLLAQTVDTLWLSSYPVADMKYSPDGKYIAICVPGYPIRLIDAMTGNISKTFTQYLQPIVTIAFSPDGKYLSGESADGHTIVF